MIKESLSVSLVQTSLFWEDTEANLANLEELIWQNEDPTDVIVLPEMFSTGFTMNPTPVAEPMNSKTFRWMKQVAKQKDALVIGSVVIVEGRNYYNRLFCVRPDEQYAYYDKKHLFTLAGEGKEYTAGNNRLIVEWRGWKIMPLICYDLRFPVWARSQRTNESIYEYDILVYVSNWPSPRVHAWDTLLKARAIENISYCVGVNRIGKDENQLDYPGHSALIDYTGKELVQLDNSNAVMSGTLEKSKLQKFRENFPFQADSDGFELSS